MSALFVASSRSPSYSLCSRLGRAAGQGQHASSADAASAEHEFRYMGSVRKCTTHEHREDRGDACALRTHEPLVELVPRGPHGDFADVVCGFEIYGKDSGCGLLLGDEAGLGLCGEEGATLEERGCQCVGRIVGYHRLRLA